MSMLLYIALSFNIVGFRKSVPGPSFRVQFYALSDLDTDGRPDIYCIDMRGRGYVFHNLGRAVYMNITDSTMPAGLVYAMAGDFDRDGKVDMVVFSVDSAFVLANRNMHFQRAFSRGLPERGTIIPFLGNKEYGFLLKCDSASYYYGIDTSFNILPAKKLKFLPLVMKKALFDFDCNGRFQRLRVTHDSVVIKSGQKKFYLPGHAFYIADIDGNGKPDIVTVDTVPHYYTVINKCKSYKMLLSSHPLKAVFFKKKKAYKVYYPSNIQPILYAGKWDSVLAYQYVTERRAKITRKSKIISFETTKGVKNQHILRVKVSHDTLFIAFHVNKDGIYKLVIQQDNTYQKLISKGFLSAGDYTQKVFSKHLKKGKYEVLLVAGSEIYRALFIKK